MDPNESLHINKSIVFPIKKSTLQGLSINIPANPVECCSLLYGKEFMLEKTKREYSIKMIDHTPTHKFKKDSYDENGKPLIKD